MASARMRRVDGAVKAVLSEAIAKDLRDPRVGFVTVTGVKTSQDLRQARVYVSVLGDERTRAESLARPALRSWLPAAPRRHRADAQAHADADFEYDESVDHGMRITQLLGRRPDDA